MEARLYPNLFIVVNGKWTDQMSLGTDFLHYLPTPPECGCEKEWRMFVRLARIVSICLIGLAVYGCASLPEERGWIDNQRALASTLRRPTKGDNDVRAYLNKDYLEANFASVKVLTPSILLSPQREGERKFLSRMVTGLGDAAINALWLTEKFTLVLADTPGVASSTELSIEAWVHLANDDMRLVADPLFQEKVSRLVVIYTLTETASGKTIAKYTANLSSKWDHPERVKEDMLEKTTEAADELGFMLYQL
jgi:hypothetical protein